VDIGSGWIKPRLYAKLSFTNVSKSTIDSYVALNRDDPCFLYDTESISNTVGKAIEHRLWHCIPLVETIEQQFDDLYMLTLEVGILRHWR